jgi:hypothetical protein
MKKAAIALFFMMLGSVARSGEKWNDALSGPSASSIDSITIHQDIVPAGIPSATPSLSLGRQILIAHLNQIKSMNLMINTITLEPYWQGVFAAAGHPELYVACQPDIQIALEAGLSPYLRGEAITAQQFADAAIAALQAPAKSTPAAQATTDVPAP